MNDDKPRIILKEYKVAHNVPNVPTIIDENFTIDKFKKTFKIVIVKYNGFEIEFDLIGVHPIWVNTLRRICISDVPTMAIEKVEISNNTSILRDEVLAHRLGLIPLKADPRLFEFRLNSNEDFENDTLEFELKIKCSQVKKKDKESASEIVTYKDSKVFSKHIKWVPNGNQANIFKEEDVGPVHDDILINKLRPGQEIDLKMKAVKSVGRDHAKFSPVATASYRILPDIHLTREVKGEQAIRLSKCFSPGVIQLVKNDDGESVAQVKNSRYDTCSRNVFRFDDLKDSVIMSRIEDHFIFTIESTGALKADDIFVEAIKHLKCKAQNLLENINNRT